MSRPSLSRQQFSAIAWLRWRIFANSMRRKGARAELAVRFLSYPLLALMILGPSIGAGFAGFYLVSSGMDEYLPIPLWSIFVLWQFIGVNTSTTAPPFDLSTLIRFPMRYRDYFVVRLSFGLLDAPTLVGVGCLVALSIGIGVAAPSLFPWATVTLLCYAICNILFSRMLYSWLERWLAQRRTRELITGIILLLSLGFQFAGQFAHKFGIGGRHAAASPLIHKVFSLLLIANHALPPGLASSAIESFHRGSVAMGLSVLGGLIAFTFGFVLILHLRFQSQYLGESLSDAPTAAKIRPSSPKSPSLTSRVNPRPSGLMDIFPGRIAAGLTKELHYLLRSGPKLYVLIMPVFVVLLFSARSSGMNYIGVGYGEFATFLFSYGCAYTQLLLVGMLYNSLGSDNTGVQFYFLAPIRMRDVLMAKNLLTGIIVAIEAALIYLAATFLSARPPLNLVAATLAWALFTFFVNASVGNIRSLTSPKFMDPGKLRGQNISGVSGLISLLITMASVGLGYLVVFACKYLHADYWMAAGVFILLAGVAGGFFLVVLQQLDGIAAEHAEDLIRDLCKT